MEIQAPGWEVWSWVKDAIAWECDAVSLRFGFVSASAEQILGYGVSQWLQQPDFWETLIHPGDYEWVLATYREGKGAELEYRCIAVDGRVVWVRNRTQVVGLKLRGLMMDITAAKLSQQALRESEERYRSLVLATAQVVWTTAPDGQVVSDMPSWRAYTGQSETEILGWSWIAALYPDDRDRTAKIWNQAVATKSVYEAEYRLWNQHQGYRYVWARGVPVIDDGNIREWVGTCTDISDRKAALDEAKESEVRFRSMADSAPVLIWVAGTDGLCIWFNQVWLDFTGRTLEEERGNGWMEGVHPQDYQRCLDSYWRAFYAQQGFKIEYRLRRADGQYRWVLSHGVPRFTPSGDFAGYIGSCIDISDRIAQEAVLKARAQELIHLTTLLTQTNIALEKRNQELDQFAYVTSHDLKAPLRAIANLSEWIEEDVSHLLGDENKRHMHLLRQRVHRMEALIDGLLQYSRVGRINVVPTTVSVATLIGEIIDSLVIPDTFTIEIQPEMPTFVTERLPLEQVFSNLITNAIKHHPRLDGKVTISVDSRNGFYEFAVSDDGAGIDPQYHEKIFGIFQTLEARDKVENTGIGLAIVKKIVENHQGSICVESQPDKGTTFRFTWPH